MCKEKERLIEIACFVVHKSKDVNLERNNCVGIKFEENGDVSDLRIISGKTKRKLKKRIADFIPRGYIQLRNWDLKKMLIAN